MQPVQLLVPVPASCLQLVTLVHVDEQATAELHLCELAVALVAVSWQLPAPQFWVLVEVESAVSWQLLLPPQFWVQVEPALQLS